MAGEDVAWRRGVALGVIQGVVEREGVHAGDAEEHLDAVGVEGGDDGLGTGEAGHGFQGSFRAEGESKRESADWRAGRAGAIFAR
jgi:hypothetical protein